MWDAVYNGIVAAAVGADELAALKLDVALADGANKYFQQFWIDCFRHSAQIIFGFVLL